LIAGAERVRDALAGERAKATERAEQAKARVARIERGEDVQGGLGEPLRIEDLLAAVFRPFSQRQGGL
jgi:hypothetical protein